MKKSILGILILGSLSAFAESNKGIFDDLGFAEGGTVISVSASLLARPELVEVKIEDCNKRLNSISDKVRSINGIVTNIEKCKVTEKLGGILGERNIISGKVHFIR